MTACKRPGQWVYLKQFIHHNIPTSKLNHFSSNICNGKLDHNNKNLSAIIDHPILVLLTYSFASPPLQWWCNRHNLIKTIC